MAEDFNGQACGPDTAALPPDPVPATAYVPFQQWSGTLFGAEQAFDTGTLFPILDKPFRGGRREPR